MPGVTELRSIPDFRSWLLTLINPVSGHTQPLQYKMLHNETSTNASKVDIYYRGCSTDSWKIMGSLLKSKLTPRIIGRRPLNVLANLESFDLHTLNTRITSWSTMFDHSDDSSIKWWQCFSKELKNVDSNEKQLRLFSNRGSRWHLPHFSRCRKEKEAEYQVEEVIGPHLLNMLNEEIKEPQVCTQNPQTCWQKMAKRVLLNLIGLMSKEIYCKMYCSQIFWCQFHE